MMTNSSKNNNNSGYQATVVEPQQIIQARSTPNSSRVSLRTGNNNGNSQLLSPPPVPPPHGIFYQQIPSNNTSYASLNTVYPNNRPEDMQYFQQQQQPVSENIAEPADDHDYLPDSSLQMAVLAGKRRYDRLHCPPTDPNFPPVTVENINTLRQESQTTRDPQLQFFFARYLLEAAVQQLNPTPQDPQRSQQLKENLTNEAIKIMRKLASHKIGLVDAQLFLGNCYGSGLWNLKTDVDKAFSYYVQGSKQSHPECTYRAAVCYELGLGTKKDARYAMQFFRKAANASNPSAMYKLGIILLNGLLGQGKNPREAMSWFLRAAQVADEEHPQCLHELGLAYEKTDKNSLPSVIPDIKYARELFSQAAQFGFAPSQYRLGLAYEHGQLECPIDPRRSIAWYSRAAEQHHSEAELALSGWYLTGDQGVLRQSDIEAYLWAKKAADHGLAKAEYAVGYYTETGVGTPPNLDAAREWYTKASYHGDAKAKQRLQLFNQQGVKVKRRPTRDKNGKPNVKDSDCRIM